MRNEKIAVTGDHVDGWTEELTQMHKLLHKRNKAADVVLVQVPQIEHISGHDCTDLLQSFQSFFKNNSSIVYKTPVLGLDFDSAFLYGLSETQVDGLIRLLDSLPSDAQLGAISVAGGPLSFQPAARLVQWARSKGLRTFATEVMRCHPRRPSQVATNYSFANEHRPVGEDKIFRKPQLTSEVAESTTISPAEKQRMLDIMEAANDLTMTLDRCVKVERAMLEEVSVDNK